MFVLVNRAFGQQEWRGLDSWFSTPLVHRPNTNNVPKPVGWSQSNTGMAKTMHGTLVNNRILQPTMKVSERNENVIGDGSTDVLHYPRVSITHRGFHLHETVLVRRYLTVGLYTPSGARPSCCYRASPWIWVRGYPRRRPRVVINDSRAQGIEIVGRGKWY